MSYYNSNQPAYNNTTSNTFVASTPNFISSPFDDDPVPAHNPNYPYEKNNSSYNPDYMPNNNTNNYNQSPYHSTQEHSLSPSFTEKALPVAGDGQTYAMQHIPNQNNDPYNNNRDSYGQNYYNGYDEDRPSLSNDTAPMRPHSDLETSDGLTRSKSGVTRVKYAKEKSKYLPCFPCIRSTCGRVTCCICLFLLIVIIALVIVVFTVFKLPTVNYLGMQNSPQFLFNQGNVTLSVAFTADIQVINPNPLGFNFESIVATAYYPNYAPSIGGGNLTNVDFPSHSNKTIEFPIAASYSGAEDKGFTVIKDILVKCGFTGSAQTQLTIDYDLKLTIKIIGINISPTIKNQHANFPCPDNIADIAANIPGGVQSIIGA
ncbi:hypothetical protein BGZ46_002763 [Entomortierella lignicola]|nr:hypothetical protein BGZ46_002763 [Entomortierella lignicola]